ETPHNKSYASASACADPSMVVNLKQLEEQPRQVDEREQAAKERQLAAKE
ncbi:hypothetical protein Tco_0047971, partial [Tanacetum coccineum]